MNIFKKTILGLVILLMIVISTLLYFYKVDITTNRSVQNYYEVLAQDSGKININKINPNLINLVKSVEYGLFINIWRVNKRYPSYEATHLFEISWVNYKVTNSIKDYKIEEIK